MRRFVMFGVVTFLCLTMGSVVLAGARKSPMKSDVMQMGDMMGQMAEMMRSGQLTPERMEQMAKMLEDMSGMMGMMGKMGPGMMGQGMVGRGMMGQGMMSQERMKQMAQMMEQMTQMQKQMMEMMGESSKK